MRTTKESLTSSVMFLLVILAAALISVGCATKTGSHKPEFEYDEPGRLTKVEYPKDTTGKARSDPAMQSDLKKLRDALTGEKR